MAKKAFKFRLQRLLEIRVMREKQAQQELLVRRDRVRQEQAALQVLIDEEAALIARMSPPPGSMVDIEDIRLCEHAAKRKREEQDTQQGKIQQAERAVNEQIIVLRQAGIDVKALEKLKEKQGAEHWEEMLHEEAVFLDDLAAQQYIRQGKHTVMLKAERASQASADAALAALSEGTH